MNHQSNKKGTEGTEAKREDWMRRTANSTHEKSTEVHSPEDTKKPKANIAQNIGAAPESTNLSRKSAMLFA